MRKIKPQFVILLFMFVLFGCLNTQVADLTLNNKPAQVYFNPNGGCIDAIVEEIGKAKFEILIQAYSFTRKEIAKSLVNASSDLSPLTR